MKSYIYILAGFVLFSCEHKTDGINENVKNNSTNQKDTIKLKEVVVPEDNTEVIDSTQ